MFFCVGDADVRFFLLRRVWGWVLVVCDGVRGLPFALQALPFGVLVFALASALRYLASGVAPVRGGTYFSLPPQRKVGKRKRLTPPALILA
ncbi:liporotein [Paraburkholderia caribensis MBA4]|uniref:Liporotein n=1 Tax=Paraburkholderia caribensis MBA4 TaxID=1323664 RepID=A0A0P0RG38_9BURK|nr:liporotein [Paraburkholderia caribensis MBA4]